MQTKLLFSLACLFSISSIHLYAQKEAIDYGASSRQVEILNLDCLHQRGFTGEGITIGHFDDGYDGFEEMEVFEHIRRQNLLVGAYDFVKNREMTYSGLGSHGTNTVSIVHGYLPGKYVGTAFGAKLLLARTEDNRSETNQEEHNWKKAVDWALENGVDVITSSLQYNTFDPGQKSYKYQDMDGKTTIISQAAGYAAARGVLVVTIQGNFGSDPWYYVTAPGDADSVLTVGAVNPKGRKAGFSSFGPSADGRIKPDVMAVGERTQLVDPNGRVRPGNGTSFAAPGMAGLAACLVQAHPGRTNMEIIAAIRQSSSRYFDPDPKDGFGYGIPDACKADEILSTMDDHFANIKQPIEMNGFRFVIKGSKLRIEADKMQQKTVADINLYSATDTELQNHEGFKKKLNIKGLKKGLFLVKIKLTNGNTSVVNLFYPG